MNDQNPDDVYPVLPKDVVPTILDCKLAVLCPIRKHLAHLVHPIHSHDRRFIILCASTILVRCRASIMETTIPQTRHVQALNKTIRERIANCCLWTAS